MNNLELFFISIFFLCRCWSICLLINIVCIKYTLPQETPFNFDGSPDAVTPRPNNRQNERWNPNSIGNEWRGGSVFDNNVIIRDA